MLRHYIDLNGSGVVFPADWAGVADEVLSIQLSQTIQKTLAQIVTLLDDTSKTAVIYYHGDEGEDKTFEGYTHIIAALDRRNQKHGVLVQLQKGE